MTEKEIEKNELDYESQIVKLDFPNDIRNNIGMYIGNIGDEGCLNLCREIYQNAFDEFMRDISPCDLVKMWYDEITHIFTVEDNGRGIPFSKIIDVFSNSHTSSNYNKQPFQYTSGKHGFSQVKYI